MSDKLVVNGERTQPPKEDVHRCPVCGRDMGYQWLLYPICPRCVRAAHRKAVTGKSSR